MCYVLKWCVVIMFLLSIMGLVFCYMDFDNNMLGVNGEIKKDGFEIGEEKCDFGLKFKKLDEKSLKIWRMLEFVVLDVER